MESRISIVTLGVKDLERSLCFYRDGLGLPTTRKADQGIIFFQTSGVCLALYPYQQLAKDVSEKFVVEKSNATIKAKPSLYYVAFVQDTTTNDIDAAGLAPLK